MTLEEQRQSLLAECKKTIGPEAFEAAMEVQRLAQDTEPTPAWKARQEQP